MYKLMMQRQTFSKGVLYAVSAYLLWGILPLYWKLLSALNPVHILAYRILFSVILVSIVLFAGKNTAWLEFYGDWKKALLLTLAALTISINWGLYIYAVNSGHAIESSLGYYINPLFTVALGLIFFREKLKPLQLIAFGFAFAGVAIITVLEGRLPLISLALALTFALYGLLKKTINFSALESLGAETLIASPLGLALLFTSFGKASVPEFPSFQGILYWIELPLPTLLLLLLCGAATSLPLFLFARSAKLLPLSTLGFFQFLSPTMTFLTGYFIFGEYFPAHNFIAFAFIWAAVILYIISLKTKAKDPESPCKGQNP